MKRLFALCTVLALALGASAFTSAQAPATDVTGNWSGTFSTPNGDVQLTFHFKQDGQKLTGTVDTNMGGDAIEVQNGKVDGDKIYWETSVNGMTITHDGTVNGDEMKVTVKGSGDNGFPPAGLILKRARQ